MNKYRFTQILFLTKNIFCQIVLTDRQNCCDEFNCPWAIVFLSSYIRNQLLVVNFRYVLHNVMYNYIYIVNLFQRGKFRPRLTELVASNADSLIKEVSVASFKNFKKPEIAIKELSKLRGVGPATASGEYFEFFCCMIYLLI